MPWLKSNVVPFTSPLFYVLLSYCSQEAAVNKYKTFTNIWRYSVKGRGINNTDCLKLTLTLRFFCLIKFFGNIFHISFRLPTSLHVTLSLLHFMSQKNTNNHLTLICRKMQFSATQDIFSFGTCSVNLEKNVYSADVR